MKYLHQNKPKNVLVEKKSNKLHTFDSIQFRDKSHFEDDGTQNHFKFKYILELMVMIFIIFYYGNLKDSLIEVLKLLLYLLIFLMLY